jgi:hypothetical protein
MASDFLPDLRLLHNEFGLLLTRSAILTSMEVAEGRLIVSLRCGDDRSLGVTFKTDVVEPRNCIVVVDSPVSILNVDTLRA